MQEAARWRGFFISQSAGLRSRTSRCGGRRRSCGHDLRRASRSKHCRSAPRGDIGHDPAAIFVRPDIEDRDIAFAEQRAQRGGRGLGHLQFLRTGGLQLRRVDAAQTNPRGQIEVRRQMNPRLERVAIDGADHIDGVAHIGISGPLPDHLGVARRLAVCGRARQSPAGASASTAAPAASSPPPRRSRTSRATPPTNQRRQWPRRGVRYVFILSYGDIFPN